MHCTLNARPQQSGDSTLRHTKNCGKSTSTTWERHWTWPPASERLSCMSLSGIVSGECHQTAQTHSDGCQILLMTHSNHGHCQWHQLACWWRHTQNTPVNWDSLTQTAMNWDVFNYRTTWNHVTPWSRQLGHSSSDSTTHNWSRIRSLKSTLEVKCCVSSVIHV